MVMKTYECLLTCASLPHPVVATALSSSPLPMLLASKLQYHFQLIPPFCHCSTIISCHAGWGSAITHTHTSSLGVYTHKKVTNDRLLKLFVPPSLVWTMQLVVQLLTTLPPHMGCGTWRPFSPGWTTVNRSSAQLMRQGSLALAQPATFLYVSEMSLFPQTLAKSVCDAIQELFLTASLLPKLAKSYVCVAMLVDPFSSSSLCLPYLCRSEEDILLSTAVLARCIQFLSCKRLLTGTISSQAEMLSPSIVPLLPPLRVCLLYAGRHSPGTRLSPLPQGQASATGRPPQQRGLHTSQKIH